MNPAEKLARFLFALEGPALYNRAMKDERHLFPWGRDWTCNSRLLPIPEYGIGWWVFFPHALLLIWAALLYFESLREFVRETVPVAIGAWTIYVIVRFVNRRDDPREQKRRPDLP